MLGGCGQKKYIATRSPKVFESIANQIAKGKGRGHLRRDGLV